MSNRIPLASYVEKQHHSFCINGECHLMLCCDEEDSMLLDFDELCRFHNCEGMMLTSQDRGFFAIPIKNARSKGV